MCLWFLGVCYKVQSSHLSFPSRFPNRKRILRSDGMIRSVTLQQHERSEPRTCFFNLFFLSALYSILIFHIFVTCLCIFFVIYISCVHYNGSDYESVEAIISSHSCFTQHVESVPSVHMIIGQWYDSVLTPPPPSSLTSSGRSDAAGKLAPIWKQ